LRPETTDPHHLTTVGKPFPEMERLVRHQQFPPIFDHLQLALVQNAMDPTAHDFLAFLTAKGSNSEEQLGLNAGKLKSLLPL
jgi:hypothetical protein